MQRAGTFPWNDSSARNSILDVEPLSPRGAKWLVWGLLVVALMWAAVLAIVALPGPWGWEKLLSFAPLLVVVWSSRSISREQDVRTSIAKAFGGSLGLVVLVLWSHYGFHLGRIWHGFPINSGVAMTVLPVVFFLVPAAVLRQRFSSAPTR
jgi:hypothetical protein